MLIPPNKSDNVSFKANDTAKPPTPRAVIKGVIETPKDYSTLFVPCINRLESPIIPLTGLVDSDVYDNVVNIPFLHTDLEPGGKPVIIPAGTPICRFLFWPWISAKHNAQDFSNSVIGGTFGEPALHSEDEPKFVTDFGQLMDPLSLENMVKSDPGVTEDNRNLF